jgi:TatD DNase family protein
MIIDTHAHVNFKAFDNDRNDVLNQCQQNNIGAINVGTSLITSQKAIDIAMQHQNMWASVGLHPIHLASKLVKLQDDEEEDNPNNEIDFDYDAYKKLAENDKVVAIGEIGLDYYYKPKNTGKKEQFKIEQLELFKKELQLAKALDKACIIHCRMAYEDMLAFFKDNSDLIPKRAVLHCFMAPEYLQQFLDLGFYIGYNGIIYKDSLNIDFADCIKKTPLDRIVAETDCPYLTPSPDKDARNTPMGVITVLETIAQAHNISYEQAVEVNEANAKRLFNI